MYQTAPHLYGTYQTIRDAFNSVTVNKSDTTGTRGNVNLSSIFSKIITEAGRLTDNYASDILFGLSKIDTLVNDPQLPLPEGPDRRPIDIDEIFVFAIRQMGCDHDTYLMTQLLNSRHGLMDYVYATPYYRRILAVNVKTESDRIDCILRDLTNAFHRINPADLDANGKLVELPSIVLSKPKYT